MPFEPLGKKGKEAIDIASRSAISTRLSSMVSTFYRGVWVDANNKYRRGIGKTLQQDYKAGQPVDDSSLSEYIAASGPLHCADGWGYLGRALLCHCRGDSDTSRHLAYYAELRAAMALLATEGIGIFKSKHYVVDQTAQCHELIGSSTHEISWQALDYWGSLSRSADLLGSVIRPSGIPLRDWLDAFNAGTALGPLGSKWLKSWGLDLRHLIEDRNARNESSYEPTAINPVPSLDGLDTASFLRELWELHEPSQPSRFDKLDRHLLRIGLEKGYSARNDATPEEEPSGYKSTVGQMLSRLSLDESLVKGWTSFLTRGSDSYDGRIIREAENTSDSIDPCHHMEVISRANLLLRVATGASERLLRSAGVGRQELEFWWLSLGEDRGLWAPGGEPEELIDLWLDVKDELVETELWEEQKSKPTPISHWLQDRHKQITSLSGSERIALWGLGL